jgi:putative phage-type endonuclease
MIQQNTPEWLAMRKNYIGASDAPPIVGVSPWTTPYQLWQEKLSLTKEGQKTGAMHRGNVLEEPARHLFESMTGLLTAPEVKFHPTIKYMMASMDGIDVEGKSIVEIKCPNKQDHAIAEAGEIPEKYFPQLQHQLEVCELEMAYYFSFDGETGVIVKVFRDEKYIKELLQKEKEFWECVQELRQPNLTPRDYVQKSTPQLISQTNLLKDIRKQLKELTSKEEEIEKELIMEAGTQNLLVNGISVSRNIRKGTVDYKMIPELQNIDLEQYRKKPIEYWNIREKKE